MATQRSDSSANALLDLVGGHRITAVIYVAARLGIADFLVEGPKSGAELARLTNAQERSLLRLMRALVTLAICTEASAGSFNLTEVGTHLAANSERSLKAWTLFEGEMLRARWGQADRLDSHRQDRHGASRAWPRTLRGDGADEGCRIVQ